MSCRVCKPTEYIPPVGDNGDETSHHFARLEFLRCKPSPTPLILEFVEIVLAVTPVAIKLGNHRRIHLFVVRDKCAVAPFAPRAVLDELELLLLRTNGRNWNDNTVLWGLGSFPFAPIHTNNFDFLFCRSADEKYSSGLFPSVKPKCNLPRLPAKPAGLPFGTVSDSFEQSLDVRGTPYFEEIRNPPRFRFAHYGIAAISNIAANKCWAQVLGKRVYEMPQPRRTPPSGVLFTRTHIDDILALPMKNE